MKNENLKTGIITVALGVDIGNSETKTPRNEFSSRIKAGFDNMKKANILKFENLKNVYEVEYKGSTYTVGEGTEITGKQKYSNEFYKILILTTIGAEYPDNTDINCNLIIGLPVQYFKNKKFKEEIEKSLLITENIKINNIPKRISIAKISFSVEGAIIIRNPESYENEDLLVVDIGGGTIDALRFKNNEIRENKSYVNKGVTNLKNTVLKAINEDNNTNLVFDSADEILKIIINNTNKNYELNNKQIDLSKYENIIKLHINEIIQNLEMDFGIDDKLLIFLGGGSKLLEKYLNKLDETYNIQIETNTKLNAETFNDIAKLYYSDDIDEGHDINE